MACCRISRLHKRRTTVDAFVTTTTAVSDTSPTITTTTTTTAAAAAAARRDIGTSSELELYGVARAYAHETGGAEKEANRVE
jgi:hypothetical protein